MDRGEHVGRQPWSSLRSCTALAAVALTLAACTPNVDGITGITRDDQGHLIGLWQGCTQEQTAAALTQDEFTGGAVHVGEWVPRAPSLQGTCTPWLPGWS